MGTRTPDAVLELIISACPRCRLEALDDAAMDLLPQKCTHALPEEILA